MPKSIKAVHDLNRDSNLFHNWPNYTFKKLTEDKEIINQFLSLHWIDMSHVDTDAECVQIGSEAVSDHKSEAGM
ncbi:hypothetical protein P8452_09965 [Trifolium repens]|nr:hypothetical protein P8452_09965 [Trifolium repens]